MSVTATPVCVYVCIIAGCCRVHLCVGGSVCDWSSGSPAVTVTACLSVCIIAGCWHVYLCVGGSVGDWSCSSAAVRRSTAHATCRRRGRRFVALQHSNEFVFFVVAKTLQDFSNNFVSGVVVSWIIDAAHIVCSAGSGMVWCPSLCLCPVG